MVSETPLGGLITVDCQHIGVTLTKDWIASYSKVVGDGKTTSDILTDLLAYQEVERITLGGVTPTLDKVIPIVVSWQNIWSACKLVRDTVGGFLHIITNPNNPLERELWLTDSLGRETGQQIRLGKNLAGLNYETDYISFANRLYVVGGGGELLSDKSYVKASVDQDEDVSYGYLFLREKHGAYKDWTGEGDASPANVTVWKPTGAWIAFTGDSLGAGWEDRGSYYRYSPHYAGQSTTWLTFTHAGELTTQVKFPNVWTRKYPMGPWEPMLITVEIEYGGNWYQIYQNENWVVADGESIIVSFSEQTITGMRVRYYNTADSGYWVTDVTKTKVGLWDVTGLDDDTASWFQGENELTLRCAIGVYESDIGYLVSYTHAAYLIALDDIDTRGDIVSGHLGLSETDIDALLERGRTHLDDLLEPVISIDTDLVDVSMEELRKDETLELGSLITVIDEGLNVNYSTRIVRLHKPDLLHPEKVVVELATKVRDILDIL